MARIGKLTSGISATLAERTIQFVYNALPRWRDDPIRPVEKSENRLNLQLCKYLDSYARDHFPMVRFDHEEYQTCHRSVDLSASSAKGIIIDAKQYTIYDPFLVFECKRLPAPSKDREMEYVSSGKAHTNGGIQRFKMGKHGAELEQAVMIGYIQQHSLNAWHNVVNEWINAFANGTIEDYCVWNSDELLQPMKNDGLKGLARYSSVHSRTGSKSNSKKIRISHLWILM